MLSEPIADFLKQAASHTFPREIEPALSAASPPIYAEVRDATLRKLMEQTVDRAAKLVRCVLLLQLPAQAACIGVGIIPPAVGAFMETCFRVALLALAGAQAIVAAHGCPPTPPGVIN